MTITRVVIIGAGAVGGSIGGLLVSSGASVAFVARGEHGRAIRENGLRLELFDGPQNVRSECFGSVKEVDWRSGDIAVLATKLNDAQAVLEELFICAGQHIPVVCATNGVIGEVWAASKFETVIGMVVWIPATHLLPGKVMLHTADVRGVLDIGPFKDTSSDASNQFAKLLVDAGFDSQVHDDIMAWKRAKWITNLGGAAQALVVDDWMPVLKAAQLEGEKTLEKSDLSRIPTQDLLARCDSVKMTDVEGFERSGGSTWQSRQRGKPLESIFIEGAMADLGERLGVPVPVNRILAETSKQPRDLTSSEILKNTPLEDRK